MTVAFREATGEDVFAIVALLADDVLGQTREQADMPVYLAAFARMDREGNNKQIVGVRDDIIVACYQLTIITGLSLTASTRAQLEGVRVASDLRGQGIGALLLEDAEARSAAAGAKMMQLTMNRTRHDSHRFYQSHGFEPSHVGFKKWLT